MIEAKNDPSPSNSNTHGIREVFNPVLKVLHSLIGQENSRQYLKNQD